MTQEGFKKLCEKMQAGTATETEALAYLNYCNQVMGDLKDLLKK